MMQPTDFAYAMTNFFSSYLPTQCYASENTVLAYRDTFKLLLRFAETKRGLRAERLTLNSINSDFIRTFLDWLEHDCGNSKSTRIMRLSVIHAFFRYLLHERPDLSLGCQEILNIKIKSKPKATVNYLSVEAVTAILSEPIAKERYGLRDLALLGLYAEIDHLHDFLTLTDTPDSYLGQETKVVAVKPDASGLEFMTVAGGGGGIGVVTELPSNPTNGQTVFLYNASYQYLATYYGPTAKWYRISLVGSNYPWANVYKPEALYNLLFGDATKSIVAVTVSTDFNTALRIKGATNTTKQLTWTFTSGAGDFGIWVGCETENTNYDWGYVYIDDVDISGKLGGTVVSRYISKTLTAGSHTLKIAYRKDSSGDVGYDGVQVYAVSIP